MFYLIYGDIVFDLWSNKRGNLLHLLCELIITISSKDVLYPSSFSQESTTAFVIPVVQNWLEEKLLNVFTKSDRSNIQLHH